MLMTDIQQLLISPANTACLTLLPSCHLLVACGIIAFLTTQRGSVASIAATPRFLCDILSLYLAI
uniref:Uncharacterized protein n=1 Tax=Timema monikensis TaxID=170555 RepID=A0A7R9HKX5_9NEOP|nr:unnamed protein product [Timema monikensis]